MKTRVCVPLARPTSIAAKLNQLEPLEQTNNKRHFQILFSLSRPPVPGCHAHGGRHRHRLLHLPFPLKLLLIAALTLSVLTAASSSKQPSVRAAARDERPAGASGRHWDELATVSLSRWPRQSDKGDTSEDREGQESTKLADEPTGDSRSAADDKDKDDDHHPATTSTTAAPDEAAGGEEKGQSPSTSSTPPPHHAGLIDLKALLEEKADSRAAKAKKTVDPLLEKLKAAHPNSGVEKGTLTELPKAPTVTTAAAAAAAGGAKPANKEGLAQKSDDPRTKPEKPTAKESDYKNTTATLRPAGDSSTSSTTTTEAPSTEAATVETSSTTKEEVTKEEGESKSGIADSDQADETDDSQSGGLSTSTSTSTLAPASSSTTTKRAAAAAAAADDDDDDDDDDETGDSRASTEALKSILSFPGDSSGTGDSGGDSQVEAKASSESRAALAGSTATIAIADAPAEVAANNANSSAKIEKLGKKASALERKKNSTIVINGRKFDQVESIECVDDKFYELLMSDLALVEPSKRQDYYGTYYDYEYAKAIAAIVESAQQPDEGGVLAGAKNNNKTTNKQNGGGAQAEDEQIGLSPFDNVLGVVSKFWRETYSTYLAKRSASEAASSPWLPGDNKPLVTLAPTVAPKQTKKPTTKKSTPKPKRKRKRQAVRAATSVGGQRHREVLANHKYLLDRLEQLKALLMSGEEELIVLNNRVKKLNQAVGESELQTALCSCISSRGGRAALMLMNELFVDKHSSRLLGQPEVARKKGERAALDTAEFCAYWYGDTIRSTMMQKERQIKELVMEVQAQKRREAEAAKPSVRPAPASSTAPPSSALDKIAASIPAVASTTAAPPPPPSGGKKSSSSPSSSKAPGRSKPKRPHRPAMIDAAPPSPMDEGVAATAMAPTGSPTTSVAPTSSRAPSSSSASPSAAAASAKASSSAANGTATAEAIASASATAAGIANGRRYKRVTIVKTRVVTTIVQMTSLWMPDMAKWIKETLDIKGANKPAFSSNMTTITEKETSEEISEEEEEEDVDDDKPAKNSTTTSGRRRRRRSVVAAVATTSRPAKAQTAADEAQYLFSTPFDQASNYADLDGAMSPFDASPLDPFEAAGSEHFRLRREVEFIDSHIGKGWRSKGTRKPPPKTTRKPSPTKKAPPKTTTTKKPPPKTTTTTTKKSAPKTTKKPAVSATSEAPKTAAPSTTTTPTTTTTTTTTTMQPALSTSARPTKGSAVAMAAAEANVVVGKPSGDGDGGGGKPTLVPPLVPSERPTVAGAAKITTTGAPATSSTRPPTEPPAGLLAGGANEFEARISERTAKCAIDGFKALLAIGYDQNALMYESERIKPDEAYMARLGDSFAKSFAASWTKKRNQWSEELQRQAEAKKNASKNASKKAAKQVDDDNEHLTNPRSVDEEIDDAFEAIGGSYERGAQLGFTLGRFVGDKAARQWPDPAELNTFTYDSFFLAGVGNGYSERDSKLLERKIVAETAKRVAFTEANRKAFSETLHSAYLNGAYLIPIWGVLHAQRAIAKQAAKEGGRIGYEAAAQAAAQFTPKAVKFFRTHQQQRALAAPYKRQRHLSDKWAGLSEQINEVQLESELNRNISLAAIDCGRKSGTLMGALLGLAVAPEAFETYARFRGSLEALENEFNQYKLGAMRGYELGETWAYLNYTAELNHNLRAIKAQTGLEKAAKVNVMRKRDTAASSADPVAQRMSWSLFEGSGKPRGPNTNNVFQFMVVNYGSHLVANHSRKHMLKLRSLAVSEPLLQEMKLQAGDLIAEPKEYAKARQSRAQAQAEQDEQLDEFEGGAYVGELKGEFNSISDAKRKRSIKFNIIDLGPKLEFDDQLGEQAKSSGKRGNGELVNTPLTVALSKVGKVFMKFNVARRKRAKSGVQDDELALFLNAAKFDEGDGYLCGTFSKLTSKLSDGTSAGATLNTDDLSLEASVLDELFVRIEEAPTDLGTVGLVEGAMSVATVAPKPIESITEGPATTTTTTTTARPATSGPPATTARMTTRKTRKMPVITSSAKPKSKGTKKANRPTGKSRTGEVGVAGEENEDDDEEKEQEKESVEEEIEEEQEEDSGAKQE